MGFDFYEFLFGAALVLQSPFGFESFRSVLQLMGFGIHFDRFVPAATLVSCGAMADLALRAVPGATVIALL
jgi:hypothetical protein